MPLPPGTRTNDGIASFVGRKSAEITHPLNVLEDCALIAREPDVFRRGRSTYRITEPLITFYEAVMRPEWYRLLLDVWNCISRPFSLIVDYSQICSSIPG